MARRRRAQAPGRLMSTNTPEPVELWERAPRASLAGGRMLNVEADVYDIRDRVYLPTLRPLPRTCDFRREVPIVRDQRDEGACTGFAMAAVVNFVMARNGRSGFDASPRFLYEHAKRYDEWKGHDYEGSSIRGAMKGFHKHGACPWTAMPYVTRQRIGRIPQAALASASGQPLGAYFRVTTSSINDMQSALAEAGILLASAQVHGGWSSPRGRGRALARIPWNRSSGPLGGHAFAIVGYDDEGFIVQNSWGPKWGSKGFAHLDYGDWLANRMDAWVAQMGIGRVEHHFPLVSPPLDSAVRGPAVDEADIRGHYVAIDDGDFDRYGPIRTFESDLDDIVAAVGAMAAKHGATAKRPLPVMLWAHGGLVGEDGAAERTLALKDPMMRAGIYPIHFIWHTGLLEEVWDLLGGKQHLVAPKPTEARVQGWLKDKLQDAKDGILEVAARPLGRPIWNEMKTDARHACLGRLVSPGPAFQLLDALERSKLPLAYHLVGHSAGSILHCDLVEWFVSADRPIASVTFLAPAVSIERFRGSVMAHAARIGRFAMYTMSDRDERSDHCGEVPGTSAGIYHKSLLYLVSYAFEDDATRRLVGLARHVREDMRGSVADVEPDVARWLAQAGRLQLHRPRLERPNATLHGSFDNDPSVIGDIVAAIGGPKATARRPRAARHK